MSTRKKIIDLNKYRTPGAKVFTGRDRGEEVRRKSKIDELESSSDIIEIIVPIDLYSINPSFLEEFLVNVVSKLKRRKFLEKFSFINDGSYKIEEDLEESIDRILREENALTI